MEGVSGKAPKLSADHPSFVFSAAPRRFAHPAFAFHVDSFPFVMAAEPVTEKPVEPAATEGRPRHPAKPRPARRARGFGRRLAIGTNVLIQIILLSAHRAFGRSMAMRSSTSTVSFDFSRNHRSTLSDRTKQFLKQPRQAGPDHRAHQRANSLRSRMTVANLATEYRNTASKFITLDIVDPFRDYTRAAEIQTKYKLAQQENVVILDCEGRTQGHRRGQARRDRPRQRR